MRRLPALVAALLIPAAQPFLVGTAFSTGTLLLAQSSAQAQTAEAVSKVAQAISVRIEGATQGSGVLVKRDGTRYTVLTAWHVVNSQRPREELDVYTPDGQRHKLDQGSIKHLGEVDMAVLSFSSSNAYEVAQVGDVKSVSSGSSIYVAGFPLPTSAVPTRIWRFLKGDVIANATVAIPNGYQLLYSNQTLPGMSGGAVMNAQGQLVGIHAGAERADQISESSGKAVATGTNQAVPIAYYSQYVSGAAVVASSAQARTADDYLVQVKALYVLGKKGSEQEVIRLAGQALAIRQSSEAYFYRGWAKSNLGDKKGAASDYDEAISINPRNGQAYAFRGFDRWVSRDWRAAITDFTRAIELQPQSPVLFEARALARHGSGDRQGAIVDYDRAISITPQISRLYNGRGQAKIELKDYISSCSDFKKAADLGYSHTIKWLKSEQGTWCRNMP